MTRPYCNTARSASWLLRRCKEFVAPRWSDCSSRLATLNSFNLFVWTPWSLRFWHFWRCRSKHLELGRFACQGQRICAWVCLLLDWRSLFLQHHTRGYRQLIHPTCTLDLIVVNTGLRYQFIFRSFCWSDSRWYTAVNQSARVVMQSPDGSWFKWKFLIRLAVLHGSRHPGNIISLLFHNNYVYTLFKPFVW
jgi:hypothetical protein